MYFLDNSGHIFELNDYPKKPIGYEYDEQDYIFWFNDCNNNTRLSINNYYGKIINVLFKVDDIQDFDNIRISNLYNIDITCDSEIFSLVSPADFQNTLNGKSTILDYVDIKDMSHYLSSEEDEDFLILKVTNNDENYIMIPIYVFGMSKYIGSWLSNILIHISHKFNNKETWCPITIGGIFDDEHEALTINGRNMGVNLPHDILKAVNGVSYFNDEFDEEKYNKKIKEYMLNYMSIKGEIGNYRSAMHSLNWFGYDGLLELYKLIETDNEYKTQYVRDYVSIKTDLIEAFRHFIQTQFIGIKFRLNVETGENDYQEIIDIKEGESDHINNYDELWGEGNPLLHTLYGDNEFKYTGEFLTTGNEYPTIGQNYKYVSPYFKYCLNELMFKLSALEYYYQTYFLPIYTNLKHVSPEYKVYANPMKHLTYARDMYIEQIVTPHINDFEVIFPKEHTIYFTHQHHYIDKYFNEFIDAHLDDQTFIIEDDKYLINDTCAFIPIDFVSFVDYEMMNNIYDAYYNCILILKDNVLNKCIYHSNFSFVNRNDNKYNGFVFYPKEIQELKNLKLYTFINKEYTLYLNVNNKWFEYNFNTAIHAFDIHIGTLKYKYYVNDINLMNKIYHDADIHNEDTNDTINNTRILFTFHSEDGNPDYDDTIDITDYIKNYDFFDKPTKYFSNFTQIDYIDDSGVHFNSYMHDTNFIETNYIKFGTDMKEVENELNDEIRNNIKEIIKKYSDTINIMDNNKYLNMVHMYDLYINNNKIDDSKKIDILKFKRNISVLIGNILIEKNTPENKFNITGNVPQNGEIIINTKDGFNEYIDNFGWIINEDNTLIRAEEYSQIDFIQDYAWYFILERDMQGNLTGNNASSLYSYYENPEVKYNVGYIIFKAKLMEVSNGGLDTKKIPIFDTTAKLTDYADYKMYDDFNFNNVKYENNTFYYTDDYGYAHTLYFKTELLEKDSEQSKLYTPYNDASNRAIEKIQYIKLNLYYYETIKVLNVYGYYNKAFDPEGTFAYDLENPDVAYSNISIPLAIQTDENNVETKTINNVQLHKSLKFYTYKDRMTSNTLTEDNPSFYWFSYDPETRSVDIPNQNSFISEIVNAETLDNESDVKTPFYINCLCKDLTGLKGTFSMHIDAIDSGNHKQDYVEMCLAINDEEDVYVARNNHDTNLFELTGKEKSVILYFKFRFKQNFMSKFSAYPKLYKYQLPKSAMENYIPIKYSDVNDFNAIDIFYKQFFYKRYTIEQYNQDNDTYDTIKELWDVHSELQLNKNFEYDSYLMHGVNSLDNTGEDLWYFMFISKNTCDGTKNLLSLEKYPDEIHFIANNTEYVLKHRASKKMFLINRMYVDYVTNNIYHFDSKDMIVCSLYNNRMLPTDLRKSTKWSILPISHTSRSNVLIKGNTNTCILSIPQNNVYNRGYYNIKVSYSLDGNVVNTSNITKKILIK